MKVSANQAHRMAGLGAFAMGAGLIVAYVVFCWFVTPRGVGIDRIESTVARISVGVIFVALVVVHVVYGRILLYEARSANAS